MAAIDRLGRILKLGDAIKRVRVKAPKHIAVSLEGEDFDIKYASENKLSLEELYRKKTLIVKNLIDLQLKLNMPILTVLLMSNRKKDPEQYPVLIDSLMRTFEELSEDNEIQKRQVKISVLGKWYALPGRLVDSVKKAIEKTKNNENFYLNLCVNYGGQSEIVDASKLIAMGVKAERFDVEAINDKLVKENAYTSYFIPPELIIINGPKKLGGFMLWDSEDSIIHFTGRPWPELKKMDVVKAIREM